MNNEELTARDFIRTGIGISLAPEGKKKVIAGYERRIQTEIVHPIFGYKVSYRRAWRFRPVFWPESYPGS